MRILFIHMREMKLSFVYRQIPVFTSILFSARNAATLEMHYHFGLQCRIDRVWTERAERWPALKFSRSAGRRHAPRYRGTWWPAVTGLALVTHWSPCLRHEFGAISEWVTHRWLDVTGRKLISACTHPVVLSLSRHMSCCKCKVSLARGAFLYYTDLSDRLAMFLIT